jgi:hypothetical protein
LSVPALNIPVRADTSKFKQDMEQTSALAGHAVRGITAQVIKMNAGWLATQGAAGGATLAFGRVLGVLGPIALGVTVVVDTFKVLAYAVDLAKKQIEEFNAVAAKAEGTGVSTDFFQRFTKTGPAAALSIDEVTAALKRFNEASTDKLGGSDLQQRLNELTKAGNFSGNSGPAALGLSTDTEGKLRATAKLISEALDKGERLAALDIAGKAFGAPVAAALQKNSGYLDDMLARADALNKSQIISPEDVGRAIELKERMDAAQKTLEDKWKPVQEDLAKLGMNYHANWVSITEELAAAVGYATQLYTALNKVPDWFAKKIGGADVWTSITNATTTPESRKASEMSLGISSDPVDIASVDSNAKLRAALQNHGNVTRGMQQATDIQSAVRGDASKNPTEAKAETADQFDRATEAVQKHTTRTEADTKAVGLGAGALGELRAEAQLLTAAQQAGLPMTQAMRDKIQDLAQDAGDAATALEKAKVAAEMKFDRGSAFLTSEDLQIASRLKGIYGDDIPAALASSEAAAMRFNNSLRAMSDLGQSINSGMFVEVGQNLRSGVGFWQSWGSAGLSALGKVADKLAGIAADNLWKSAFGGSSGGGLMSLFGLGGSNPNAGGTVLSGSTGNIGIGSYSMPQFATGTDNAPGGLARINEKGGEIVNLPSGAQVIPHDVSMAMARGGSSGGSITAPVTITIDATGADAAGLARVQQQLAQLKAELPSRVVAAVTTARKQRQL